MRSTFFAMCLSGCAASQMLGRKAGDPPLRPCDVEPGKSMSFCDLSLSRQVRVSNLVANLTTEEKIGLFATTTAAPIPRLNVPPYEWWSEALHGVGESPVTTQCEENENHT